MLLSWDAEDGARCMILGFRVGGEALCHDDIVRVTCVLARLKDCGGTCAM